MQQLFLKNFFLLCIVLFLLPLQNTLAGTILVANTLSNTVSLLDETTLKPIKELSVGYMPHEVAVTPNGKLALVSNFGDLINVIAGSTVTVIDITNAKVLKTIQLPKRSRPHGIQFLSDTDALVTAQGIQSLLLINIDSGKILKTLTLPGLGAHMIAVDTEQRYAYVTNTDSGSVIKIDLKLWSVVGHTKIGKQAEGITLTQDENMLLITNSKDYYVAVLRTKDLALLKIIRTDLGPVRVAMADNGNYAVVANSRSGTIQIIDVASFAITKSFASTISHALLFAPANITVRKDETTAYITNFLANNIALVDLKQGKVLQTFKAAYMPNGLAISPITSIKTEDVSIYEFQAGPLEINANPERVWKVMINVENYNRLSKGALSAHVNGTLAVGKTIELKLYKDRCIGKFIPPSNEIITVIDEDNKILGWQLELPLGAGHTEHYQMLTRTAENKTLSTIISRIPGAIGSFTDLTLRKTIEDAFAALNQGIKEEAEQETN